VTSHWPLTPAVSSSAATTTVQIDIWSDIACPWCYPGKRRFAAALELFPHRDRVEVVWRSYELSPDTPTGPGVPIALSQRMGASVAVIREMVARVTDAAAGDELACDFERVLAVNTFDAHRLVHPVQLHGGPRLADHGLDEAAVLGALAGDDAAAGACVDDSCSI
jgi:predicted DsbA family dithiol-disulfide isomerase